MKINAEVKQLESLARKPKDRDGFLPHLTLCRLAHGTTLEPVDHPVAGTAFTVGSFELMKSTLHPTGAWHESVGHFEL